MINLPGVAYDKEQLTEVLKKYKKFIYNSSENVLEDLKKIIEKCKQEEFERVHFHFSGKYRKIIGSIRSPRCHNVWRLGDFIQRQSLNILKTILVASLFG